MAVTVTTKQNGPRNLIVELDIASDNADAVVVDVSALGIASTQPLILVEAQWTLTGASAQLQWDQTTDAVLLEMNEGSGFMLYPEGRTNPSGAGTTGDVLLTNSSSVTAGTVILKFKKS